MSTLLDYNLILADLGVERIKQFEMPRILGRRFARYYPDDLEQFLQKRVYNYLRYNSVEGLVAAVGIMMDGTMAMAISNSVGEVHVFYNSQRACERKGFNDNIEYFKSLMQSHSSVQAIACFQECENKCRKGEQKAFRLIHYDENDIVEDMKIIPIGTIRS